MQISNPNLRRAVISAALVSASALALVGVPSAPAAAAQSPTVCSNAAIVNGSFESPVIAANTWAPIDESVVPGWETSATDNMIEIWRSPFGGVSVPAGSQFAEVNANQQSKLFQDIATTPGETIRWQLQHRGRTGVDVMEVRIGAPADALALQSTLSTGLTWTTYSGLYTVPAGQTTTRISFDSISSANGNPTYGNFVDDVSVTSGACVVTTKSVVASSDPVRLGDTLEYSIVATNQGASAASLASLVDSLPVGVSLVPGTIEITQGASTVSATDVSGDDLGEYNGGSREVSARVGTGATSAVGGTLAVGESVTVSFDVILDSVTALPSVDNTATVAFTDTLSTHSQVSTSNTTTTTITPDSPALSIVTTGTVDPVENQAAANLGNTVSWSYLVSNTGDVPVSDVTVIDPEGGTITCVPTTLAVGESATCTGTATHTVTQTDLAAGSVTNGAIARATPPYGATPVDSVEAVAAVTTAAVTPEIDVSVSHDNTTSPEPGADIVAGDQLRAHYVVTNTGNSTLTDVVVNDPMFGAVTCLDTTLEPGESTTCVADDLYTVTDDDATAGSMWRTVTATGVATLSVASTSVSDQQTIGLDVTLDLPTLPFPAPGPGAFAELPTLAFTGTDLDRPLTVALALLIAGLLAMGTARLVVVAGSRRGSTSS